MFEFHGWASIQAPEDGSSESEERYRRILAEIRAFTDRRPEDHRLADLRFMNGEVFLHVGGFANHLSPEHSELFALFRRIPLLAPDSYGLLHYCDDEDPRLPRGFRVLAITGGRIEESVETLIETPE